MGKTIKLPKNYMKKLASKGRYGDTELVHVNKDEEKLLEGYRGGELSVNPETGLKEAFPWLAAGAVVKGIGTLIGGAQKRKANRNRRRAQLQANKASYEAAKVRTPEELQYAQRMRQRAQQGSMDVPQLQSDLSRGAWSQARQVQNQQQGQMIMRGMEGSIVADEIRRKTDTDTMRMVSEQARKIAMANEQTKLQAQSSLDQYQLKRADYLRQIGAKYHQQRGNIQADYYARKGENQQQQWSAIGDTISNVMGGIGQYQATNFGQFANIGNPDDFMQTLGNQDMLNSFVGNMDPTTVMQFYNWISKHNVQFPSPEGTPVKSYSSS
tara:strand:+ start:1078 stop:2052 length:975 start_codon:yes stop_codon:yes gene_type:complete